MNIEAKHQKCILFLLGLLGLIVSVELTYVFYSANFLTGAGPSFCTINNVIDCDAVARTKEALFLGIPWSIYGLFFYSLIMGLSVFPFEKFDFFKKFKNPNSYIFCFSSLSLVYSLYLWIVSSFIIQKVCILCYVLYFVNFFLFLFSKLGKPIIQHIKDSFTDLVAILSDKKWFILAICIGLIKVGAITFVNMNNIFVPKDKITNSEEIINNTYRPSGNILGSENAALVIHEFTDFECPYCAVSNSMMYRLVSELKDIRVEHHDFPLNGACNPLVKNDIHKNSCIAAYYARAAKKQGKYWDLITLLFDNQQELSENKIIELAKTINLDIEQLKKDAYSKETKESLLLDIEKAKKLNIMATPSYQLGLKVQEGIMPYPVLKQMVEDSY